MLFFSSLKNLKTNGLKNPFSKISNKKLKEKILYETTISGKNTEIR